jgi:hypothetical protein
MLMGAGVEILLQAACCTCSVMYWGGQRAGCCSPRHTLSIADIAECAASSTYKHMQMSLTAVLTSCDSHTLRTALFLLPHHV